MRKTNFLVTYYDGSGVCPARFWGYQDAVAFATLKAARFSVELHQTIGKGRGIIGQWRNGKITPEFKGRDLPDAI